MTQSQTSSLESSAKRLFPGLSAEQAFAELLLERAQRNLVKYQAMARRFEARYQQDFMTFRRQVLASRPGFDVEQDYFDWEMAETGIQDMTGEIERLRNLVSL